MSPKGGGLVPSFREVQFVRSQAWRRRSTATLILAAACGLTALGCTEPRQPPASLDVVLKDMNGQDVNLASFKGRPIVLNFWATYCGPCKVEIPDLIALQEKYKGEGLVVLGISTDDSPEDLRAYADEHKMTYPVLVGRGHEDFLRKYEVGMGIPTSWFISRDGTVSEKRLGIAPREELERQIRRLF